MGGEKTFGVNSVLVRPVPVRHSIRNGKNRTCKPHSAKAAVSSLSVTFLEVLW